MQLKQKTWDHSRPLEGLSKFIPLTNYTNKKQFIADVTGVEPALSIFTLKQDLTLETFLKCFCTPMVSTLLIIRKHSLSQQGYYVRFISMESETINPKSLGGWDI